MNLKEYAHTFVTAERHSMVKDEASGSISRRKVGTGTGTLILEIDTNALMKMLGHKALHSKGRKSKLAGGAIVVRAANVADHW